MAAAASGYDEPDQVRLATALSELGREVVTHGGGAVAAFLVDADGGLLIEIRDFPRACTKSAPNAINGLDAARKLIDEIHVTDGRGADSVTLALRHGVHNARPKADSDKVRSVLSDNVALQPLEELRLENRDLISTLNKLKSEQEQLARLNAELEETNRGVLAMYGQISDELEETNRGVVALYAELDDKTVRLNEASEAKSRFLASVSHELRGPVNSIIGLTRLIADTDSDPLTPAQEKQLKLVANSATELLRLVNELLDLAKAESGRLEPMVASVDLAPMCSDLRGSLRPLVRAGVELLIECPESLTMQTDGALLAQVLRNVLTNAVKFTPEGSVRMTVSPVATYEIEIVVADTGIGIAEEDKTRIFEEFFQVRSPLQADYKGTGLGLPYAKRVTQSLGGRMTMHSTLGKGTTFTLRFPREWQPLLRASETPGRAVADGVSVGTVLIVDDDDGFRTALRGMLQGVAQTVVEASDGAEGLRTMRAVQPDLAFLDLRMPDMDGTDVLALIRDDPALRDTPVVIVTSAEITGGMHPSLTTPYTLLGKSTMDRDSVRRIVAQALG